MNTKTVSLIALGTLLFRCGALYGSEQASEHEVIRLKVHSYGVERSTVDMGQAAYALRGISIEAQKCHWQLGITQQAYDWTQPGEFGVDTQGRDPWETLTRLNVGFNHPFVMSDQWSGEVMAGVSGEFEDEMDDSFAGYLGGYGVYRLRPRIHLMVGVFYSHHAEVETDFDLVPLLGVAWNPEATRGFSATLGVPMTQASWIFDDRHRLLLELNTLQGGVTRLADDSPLRAGGYLERMHASLVLRYETRLTEATSLSTGISHSLDRDITLYDSDGEKVFSSDVKGGTGIELSLSTRF